MTHTASAVIQPGEHLVPSPAKALQKILTIKLSGRLTLYDPNDRSICWRLYFSKGDVHFAHSMMGYNERLSYLLQYNQIELNLDRLAQFPSDYDFLCGCWSSGQLSLQQLRKLLLLTTQDALVQILALFNPRVRFEYLVKLDPILVSMPLEHIIMPVGHLMAQWAELWPVIGSPFQRPYIVKPRQFRQSQCFDYPNEHFKHKLTKVLGQNLSLYQVSQQLDMSITEVAHLLNSFIQSGSVAVKPYATTSAPPQQFSFEPQLQKYHLLIIQGKSQDDNRRVVTLDAPQYAIGRDPSNGIVLNHKSISRQHAILFKTHISEEVGYQYRIFDGNAAGKPSTNGTFINGKRCKTHDLVSGDTIRFGPDIHATYKKVDIAKVELQAYLDSFKSASVKAKPINPKDTVVVSEDFKSVSVESQHVNSKKTLIIPNVESSASTGLKMTLLDLQQLGNFREPP